MSVKNATAATSWARARNASGAAHAQTIPPPTTAAITAAVIATPPTERALHPREDDRDDQSDHDDGCHRRGVVRERRTHRRWNAPLAAGAGDRGRHVRDDEREHGGDIQQPLFDAAPRQGEEGEGDRA
ncbi:hypothetical protein HR12_22045 [Microbacterium sp. SUBG005]|nr:hypothetical protein HR12_22045 [Microbacterium sp. SUBG005]